MQALYECLRSKNPSDKVSVLKNISVHALPFFSDTFSRASDIPFESIEAHPFEKDASYS